MSLVVALATLLVAPATAWAHAAFIESKPEPGERLQSGPGDIRLEFTEPLNRPLSEATVTTVESGERVPVTLSAEGDRQLVVRPPERLGRAAYRIDWRTVSTVDGHTLEGAFSFGVKVPAAGVEHEVEESPLARSGWLRIAARALLYAALFFFAGGVINATLLSRGREAGGWLVPSGLRPLLARAGRDPDVTVERVWRRTLYAGWLAAAGAAAATLAEAADAAGGLNPERLGDFLLDNAAGLARLWTVFAVLLALFLVRYARAAAAFVLVLAFLSIALGGHANSAEPRAPAVISDWVHLVAASVWVGGIGQIALTWVPAIGQIGRELRRAVAGSVLARFGRVALPAFLIVAASGALNALIQLGSIDALWTTAYGRVLALKIAFVGLIALASYRHALRLRPRLLAGNPHPSEQLERRHWRLLSVEPWLGVGAIAAVAALVAFPLPPSQLSEASEAGETICADCPLPELKRGEFAVAEPAGTRVAAFWLRGDERSVEGTLRLLGRDGSPVEGDVRLPGGELDDCGTGCWRLSAPASADVLTVTVEEGERGYRAGVPARWDRPEKADARRLLNRAQEKMRALPSIRMDEVVSSGPGASTRTTYRLSPDEVSYSAPGGSRGGSGGDSRRRVGGLGGNGQSAGLGGFSLKYLFNWAPFAETARLLDSGARDGVAEVALFDRATPLWYRLSIGRASGQVIRERMTTETHDIVRRYRFGRSGGKAGSR